MGTAKLGALWKPLVVASLVATLSVGTVLARSKPDSRPTHTLAAPVDISVALPEQATPDPTEEPQRRVSRSTSYRAPYRQASAPVAIPAAYTPNVNSANKIALLIGINKAPGSTPLEGSITDVKNMKETLLKFGFASKNIEVLTEGTASRGNILGALDRFGSRSRSDGIAVFLLATHSGQSGGDLTFATGGGGRVSRHELASRLGRVKGRLWSTLPTCYSAGYALPGIIGKNRIAVFSSSEDDYTWQLGGAGSWLVLYMVRYGMLERSSPDLTVEGAFKWAKERLQEEAPHRAPIIDDQISGKLSLGKMAGASESAAAKPKPKPASTPTPATPAPTPTATSSGCGSFGGLFGCRD